jgi:tRNA G46 methylase TrmB
MHANSRAVSSNQQGIHEKLEATVKKHLNSDFKRPFAEHTLNAFAIAQHFINQQQKPIILDACCGTALSTINIAKMHPEHCVIGIDQSIKRLNKALELPSNALLLQADLLDFYRLAAKNNWQLSKHFLLYPNPWPKSTQLKRRWHAMPCFPAMLQLGGIIEVRSNWPIYIEEFSEALRIAGFTAETELFHPAKPITAFEEKYQLSGHQLWRSIADLSD